MGDPRTDAVAMEAARLMHEGVASGEDEAIRRAAESVDPTAPRPSLARVRRHLAARFAQAHGADVLDARRRSILDVAEALLGGLEHLLPDSGPVLVGRAAAGHVDGDVTLFVRVRTDAPIGAVAAAVVELGYEEPSFETAETRVGRLDRIRFGEGPCAVVITRCPNAVACPDDRDLFTGQPIPFARIEGVREQLRDSSTEGS